MAFQYLTDVTNYIKRDYAPFDERLARLIDFENGLPDVLRQIKGLLEPPLARPVVKMAQEAYTGQLNYLRDNLPEIVAAETKDDGLLSRFEESNRRAVTGFEEFTAFLSEQLETAKEDFAIGGEMFSLMLAANELVDMPLERVLEVGQADLEKNRAAFIETARLIDPAKEPGEVAADLCHDHPTEDGLIPDTAAMLEEIRQYLIDHNIITVPSEVRCRVEETPEFLRYGFAFMDPPGPFEKKATEAYYYVTTVDPKWTPEEKEAWLGRFNYATLRDVSVHEAYPGHFVHFLHSARVKSPVRKVFASYSFIEGWAHYAEQMMVEEGYRNENHHLRLAQLSEALLRNCRYVCSILTHTGRMTLDEATSFFMENAYMEKLPAEREAIRGTFDPGYLNYTLGKLLILKLREDLKAREGSNFDLKRFHDSLLGTGYPPVPLARKRLLGEEGGSLL
jgi:uncharacterized protein (DUF885 family)